MANPTDVLGQPRLNEREAFTNLIQALRVAETSCRQLAYVRNQQQWMLVQLGIETMRENVSKLMLQRHTKLIHPWVT